MDRSVAMQLLGLQDGYDNFDLEDALELKLFEIKSYLLQHTVVEKVWLSKIKQVEKLQEASQELGLILDSDQQLSDPSILEFDFPSWERAVAHSNLLISNSATPSDLVQSINARIELEKTYALALNQIFRAEGLAETVSSTYRIDRGILKKAFSGDDLSQGEEMELIKELSRLDKFLSVE